MRSKRKQHGAVRQVFPRCCFLSAVLLSAVCAYVSQVEEPVVGADAGDNAGVEPLSPGTESVVASKRASLSKWVCPANKTATSYLVDYCTCLTYLKLALTVTLFMVIGMRFDFHHSSLSRRVSGRDRQSEPGRSGGKVEYDSNDLLYSGFSSGQCRSWLVL